MTEAEQLFNQSFDLNSNLVYYPVRHHSPACALHLKRVMDSYKPDIVLIEGPTDSAHLIPYIANDESVPPFCIYYSYDDADGRVSDEKEKYRAYYPFLAYSPELLAIQHAGKNSIPTRFIDLPYALRLINKIEKEPSVQFYYNENNEYEENSYTTMIARNAGCRGFSEFWEKQYELTAETTETHEFVRKVFYLGYYMRESTPADSVTIKEDRQREQYMAEEIRKSMSDYKRILVVTGAFHVTGLMHALNANEKQTLKSCKKDSVASYLMPYTFKETDSREGYAAGMPFPAFYQKVWEKMIAGKKDVYNATVLDYLITTAHYARKTEAISIPDEVNAFNMAISLAALRDKASAGVFELLDGARSSYIKGDANMTSTFQIGFLLRLLSGMGAGKVADNEFIPPVVLEFRTLCALHRFKTTNIERQEVTLDIIKNPAHYQKSRFLHQLQFLETGFGSLVSGPDYVNRRDKNLVREIWACRYSTQVETRLIDLSVYGTTLSQVCTSLIEKKFKDNITADDLGSLLISVQVMGVDDFYLKYEDKIRYVIQNERNFVNLCKLIGSLLYLANMQSLMNGQVMPVIPELSRIAFKEAVIQMAAVRHVKENEEEEICKYLSRLYSYTLEAKYEFDIGMFVSEIELALTDVFSNSRFYGACLAIYYKLGKIEQQEFCDRIAVYFESCMTQPEEAASFVCGLFLIARDVLFVDARIWQTINNILSKADNDTFLNILPNLRFAFTSFLPGEINRLGKMIADFHQVSEENFEGSMILSHEEISHAMRLDTLASENMQKWKIM